MAKQLDDMDLMRYFDGELDADTAATVEAYLASQTDDETDDAEVTAAAPQRKLQALEQMSDAVRSFLELEADDAEPRLDAMWEVIDRRIRADAEQTGVDPAVHTPTAPPAAARDGLWTRVVRFFEGYRGHILTGAVAAGAAAAIILAVRPPDTVIIERPIAVHPQPDNTARAVATVESPRPADNGGGANPAANPPAGPDTEPGTAQPEVQLVADEARAPEIEELEVNGGSGTLFVMPREGDDDVSATVIFIDFDEAEGPIL